MAGEAASSWGTSTRSRIPGRYACWKTPASGTPSWPRGAQAGGNTGYTSRSDDLVKRIDYIWISPDMVASGFALTDGTASDHLGLAVTLHK